MNMKHQDETVEVETCPYCGITAESVCDSLPANVCEQAINATFSGWHVFPHGIMIEVPSVERKKADDTEGGSAD